MSKIVERLEDMSPRGLLRLLIQDDGDVIVSVQQNDLQSADVEFCTSGGRSPRTLHALRALAKAMQEDNADPRVAHGRSTLGKPGDGNVP